MNFPFTDQSLHRAVGGGIEPNRPQHQFHLLNLCIGDTDHRERGREQFAEPLAAEFGEMRFAQASKEQAVTGFVLAEHHTLAAIRGEQMGVPAAERAGLIQRGLGNFRSLAASFWEQ